MELAIISGKGGTGKSSISAAFATLQKEVVLADCDVAKFFQHLDGWRLLKEKNSVEVAIFIAFSAISTF